jgi:hypothetical protein
MTQWHAYYFDSLDHTSPPARATTIQADDEDEAGKIAIAQMGRSMRVYVTRPVWGAPSLPIAAAEGPHERARAAQAPGRVCGPINPPLGISPANDKVTEWNLSPRAV